MEKRLFSQSFIRIGLFAFVQTDSFLILRVQTFPSVYSSQTFPFDHLCLVCVPLSNGVSLPKKVVIAFEHDLFFSAESMLLIIVTEKLYKTYQVTLYLKIVFDYKADE